MTPHPKCCSWLCRRVGLRRISYAYTWKWDVSLQQHHWSSNDTIWSERKELNLLYQWFKRNWHAFVRMEYTHQCWIAMLVKLIFVAIQRLQDTEALEPRPHCIVQNIRSVAAEKVRAALSQLHLEFVNGLEKLSQLLIDRIIGRFRKNQPIIGAVTIVEALDPQFRFGLVQWIGRV